MSKKGGDDKRTQWWSGISTQKLDRVKWVLLHSGLNVATLQNDDGLTGLQVAALTGKDRALLVILDVLRQKRELVDAVDVPDEEGRTPIMLAAMKGHAKCVDHLIYYKASLTAKDGKGMTARDHAVKSGNKETLEVIDDELTGGKDDDTAAATEEAVDADGLTSTQRSKLKKKLMKEGERKGMTAAVMAAAVAMGDDDEEGGAAGAATGGAGTAAGGVAVGGAGTADAPAAGGAAAAGGLPALPKPVPAATWPEVTTVLSTGRRELHVDRTKDADAPAAATGTTAVGAASADAASTAASAGAAAGGGGDLIDPALWHCGLLNRVEIKIPSLSVLSPLVGHLAALQTLILAGNALTELPETLAFCTDLKHLDVSNNALASLPVALGKLSKLEMLNAAGNKLASIEALAPSTSLLSLHLDRNELTDIAPLNFAALPRLEVLSVSYNKIAELPEELGALGEGNSLTVLDVSNNALTALPAGLAELKEKKLKELRTLPNPFADKKMLKILNGDRPEKLVKELFKFLAESGAGKGGKGKGKGKR